jgi:hypothetical protein
MLSFRFAIKYIATIYLGTITIIRFESGDVDNSKVLDASVWTYTETGMLQGLVVD